MGELLYKMANELKNFLPARLEQPNKRKKRKKKKVMNFQVGQITNEQYVKSEFSCLVINISPSSHSAKSDFIKVIEIIYVYI